MTASEKIVEQFKRRAHQVHDYHNELLLAVHLKQRQAALESMLSEQFVLSLAVQWEAFINDLIISYVVDDPNPYFKQLRIRIVQSVKEKFGNEAQKLTTFKPPSDLKAGKAQLLVDPKDYNVTSPSAATLTKRANELLAAPHAIKFTLSNDDSAFFDYFVALRNFLGHRSGGSRERLKAAANSLAGANSPLKGSLKDVGAYLKAKQAGGDRRTAVIVSRIVGIADKLK